MVDLFESGRDADAHQHDKYICIAPADYTSCVDPLIVRVNTNNSNNVFFLSKLRKNYHNHHSQRDTVRQHFENVIMFGHKEVLPVIVYDPLAPIDLYLIDVYLLHQIDCMLR